MYEDTKFVGFAATVTAAYALILYLTMWYLSHFLSESKIKTVAYLNVYRDCILRLGNGTGIYVTDIAIAHLCL